MKKSLVALAALAATGAFAQSSVTISGNMSLGVNSTSGASKSTTINAMDTSNSNRINVIAVEDLGGGMKLTGRVDNRLDTDNGARTTGDMFVQIDGGFGTIKVGQYTFASHAGWNSGAANTVAATATTAQTLSGKVASFTTPSLSGLTVSAALDLDTSTGGVGQNGWGLKFNYATGPIGAQLSYTLAPVIVAGDTASKATGLAVSYDFGIAKVFYNQTNVTAGTTGTAAGSSATLDTNPVQTTNVARSGASLSVSVPMGAATLRAGYMNNKGDASTSTVVDRATVGVDYALSKRTSLVAEFAQNKQAVTGANRSNASFIGVNHSF